MKQSLQTPLWPNYRIRTHCSAIKDFLQYYRGAEELVVDPKLQKKLQPFNTIEDFKASIVQCVLI